MTEQLAGHKICIISTLTLNFKQVHIKIQDLLNIFTTAFADKQNDNLTSKQNAPDKSEGTYKTVFQTCILQGHS